MISTPKIAFAVIGGSSAIAGGAIYLNIKSKTTISSLIKEEGKVILLTTSSEKQDGDDAGKIYKASNNPGGLDTSGSEATKEFKNTCASKSAITVSNSSDNRFKEVKSGCTRSLTISEGLDKEGIQILKKGDSSDRGNKAGKAYKNAVVNKKEGNGPADNDVGRTSDGSSQKSSSSPSDKFKEKCEEKSKVKVADPSSEEFQRVKAGCGSK